MNKIKARYLWISVGISFLIACGLIFAVTQTHGAWTTVVIVLLAIDFIYTTIAIQIASMKSFRYKAKPKHYTQQVFLFEKENIDDRLKQNGYQPRVVPYGISYLKVVVPYAYKIVIVRNTEKYFHHEEEQKEQAAPNKKLEKCSHFIGCEIFLDPNEEAITKLPDFNIQGEKVYYGGYYVSENQLICPNYIEPENEFVNLFQNISEDLDLKSVVEE